MIMTSKIGSLLFMQFEHFSYPRDCLFKSFSFCLLSFFLIQLNIWVVGVKIHINIVWRMSYFGSMIDIENIQRKPGLSLEKAPRLLTRKPHKQTLSTGLSSQTRVWPSALQSQSWTISGLLTYLTFSKIPKVIN